MTALERLLLRTEELSSGACSVANTLEHLRDLRSVTVVCPTAAENGELFSCQISTVLLVEFRGVCDALMGMQLLKEVSLDCDGTVFDFDTMIHVHHTVKTLPKL